MGLYLFLEVYRHAAEREDTIHFLVPEAHDRVSLRMKGETYVGLVERHAQATITWSNGEVWLRQ